jgi:alpha-1,2-mannosyltransferase
MYVCLIPLEYYVCSYPHATLLLQSLGSILVALEALSQAIPDILVDSMGYAAIYPFFKYMGCCKIVAYVHYPTISSDMLDAVESGMMSVNNSALFTRNHLMKSLKL